MILLVIVKLGGVKNDLKKKEYTFDLTKQTSKIATFLADLSYDWDQTD